MISPDCRFLCASAAAYGIQWDGSLQPTEPYYSAAGFQADPVAFAAGVDSIDGCLVGTNQDGVIVAFRGTLPPNHASLAVLLDWLNDADSFPAAAPGIPGAVHLGFWKALMSLWIPVLAEIRRQATRPDGSLRPIYLTGHSKGGALAYLAAMQLVRVENLRPAGVTTFANPHAGDEDFATAYDAEGISSLRYEFQDDIVPHVPPSAPFLEILRKIPLAGGGLDAIAGLDYRPVGTLRFVDWNGAPVGDSAALERQRFEKLLERFLLLQEVRIAEDHFATCGGGYMTYICPTGVCPVKG